MRKSLDNCDTDSNDSAEKFVAVNYNKNSNDLRAASPPSLKRNHVEEEEPKVEPKFVKKLKQDLEVNGDVPKVESVSRDDKVQTLRHVRQFFRRENNGVLAKLKQEVSEDRTDRVRSILRLTILRPISRRLDEITITLRFRNSRSCSYRKSSRL